MTYGRFIFKNTLRNKRRTALTVLSIGFSLFLLIMLQSLLDFFEEPPGGDKRDLRLVVQRSTAFVDGMPMSYIQRLEKIPNVNLVIPVQIFGGYYKDPQNIFPSMGTDPTSVWKMFPEQRVTQETIDAMIRDRTAAVVGVRLMERFHWKVGQKVTLISGLVAEELEFTIVGTYDSEIPNQDDAFYFRYDYLNEAMGDTNQCSFFWLQADHPDSIPSIVEKVDETFRNTPAETRTTTEKSFIVGFISMLGNIRLLMRSVAVVVVFTMLLVAGSTIAITIRERFREVGILKSMGYTRNKVLMMILGEAALIGTFGGLFGSGLAFALKFVNLYALTGGFVQELPIKIGFYFTAISLALVIGLAASIFPALRASRLTITEAMRRLE